MRIFYLNNCNSVHDFRFLYKFVEKRYEAHAITSAENYLEMKGIEYHQISFPNLFLRQPRKLRRAKKELQSLINKYKPDIIHAGWIPAYGFLAAYTNSHPLLLMPWGSDILLKPYEFYNLKESWMSPLNKIYTQFAIKRADMIQCDAEHTKNELIKLSGYPENKIIVFPQGIDLKTFNPRVDGNEIRKRLGWQDKKILIMTRSFKPVYGLEYFLRAIPKIIKEVPETRIVICGLPEHSHENSKKNFKEFLEKNKLTKYVHFAGAIKNKDMPKYFAASDVYISTSLSDGTSTSLLEAMAVGLPCVVTDLPAIKEWIVDGKNGFVVPKKDSLTLANKIIYLISDENLRNKFRDENIRIAFERANWDKNFEKLECMYNELIS